MNALKKLPITYQGELHEVKLINFSVDLNEVLPLVPKGIKVREFDGKAIISMVNVKLRQMRPKGLPQNLSFDYQHVAFRLLVDDREYNDDNQPKGIYFIKSFTNKPWVAWSGSRFTHYKLSSAELEEDEGFELRQGEHFVRYELTDEKEPVNEPLKAIVQPLDRAYAVDDGQLLRTRIQREEWPIKPVHCRGIETNFFKTASFLGAFEVQEVIDYEWMAPVLL